MEILVVFASLVGGADRLGDPDYWVRENAERDSRRWGWAAWPFLLRAESSDDPEVRERAARLLRPYHSLAADLRALAVLRDPWPVNANQFYADRQLRERIRRVGILAGHERQWWVDWLTPDDDHCVWNWDANKHAQAVGGLEAARRAFGNDGPGWPFTR